MSIPPLARFILAVGLAAAILPYLSGVIQRSPHSHTRHAGAYEINILWWRYELVRLNVNETSTC